MANGQHPPQNSQAPAQQRISVAVPGPFSDAFDYLPEAERRPEDYPVGARVAVPFGSRTLVGYVVQQNGVAEIAANKLKQIKQLLDSEKPSIDNSLMRLAHWASNYYHQPLGDCLSSLLPNYLNNPGVQAGTGYDERFWQISALGLGLAESSLKRAPRQQALINDLRTLGDQGWSDRELAAAGHSLQSARELAKKGLIEAETKSVVPPNCESIVYGQEGCAHDLNDEQAHALATISAQLGKFSTILLEGITGSGKTEVYLQAIKYCLDKKQQVLVLVPEIGLTPQTVERFASRFDCQISVLHSGLNDRERLAAWQQAQTAKSHIVIGTRSAIFTPLPHIGLIVIDEEHDNSFKQQEGLRYHARDLAIVRAQLESVPVVLGSATPALETLANANNGKYLHTSLTKRNGTARPASIELIDVRKCPLNAGLSDAAVQSISTALQEGNQALVFINRRGFAPLMVCHDCGWSAECSDCDARLTLHQQERRLRCHHCDAQQPLPHQCPRCDSTHLQYRGQGTEQTSQALQQIYPETPVIRIDRDSTSTKQSFAKRLEQINQNRPLIIVGTQMLAKGHDFKRLSTVIVLNIDDTLYHADFRAYEKALQLLTQVSGRAGRSNAQGRVLVQTHLPDHPLLNDWAESGYQSACRELLDERKRHAQPPFTYMAAVRADSPKPQAALKHLQQTVQHLTQQFAMHSTSIGPIPAVMEKRAGRHRALWLLKSDSRKLLHNDLNNLQSVLSASKTPSQLRWSIDVDPVDDM